mgnify:CR=1 FL=1
MPVTMNQVLAELDKDEPDYTAAAKLGADDETEVGVAGRPVVDPAFADRLDVAVGFDEVELAPVDSLSQIRRQERFGRSVFSPVEFCANKSRCCSQAALTCGSQ